MQNKVLAITDFLDACQAGIPVVDVRTPAEFKSGHIPGAVNIPLFDDEQRKEVGTTYKREGRNPAILQGLGLVGPRIHSIAHQILEKARENQVHIYCWRGGMRSASVSWLMNLLKVQTATLFKGYKSFRNYVLDTFQLAFPLIVLGGKTGSGKTRVLKELELLGEQVIDLEGLAGHKGSAFGDLNKTQLTTQEMFENNLASALRRLDPQKPVWIEDESRMIGHVSIPQPLWESMRNSKIIFLEIPQSERVCYLSEEYAGSGGIDAIKDSFYNIKKRLGDVRYRDAILALESGDFSGAAKLALDYYDRAYEYGLQKREPHSIKKIKFESINAATIAGTLQQESACQR